MSSRIKSAWRGISAAPASLRTIGLATFLLALSVISGMVAATASPVLLGLVAGLIGGTFLLAKPTAAVDLLIAVGLTMGALLSLAGPAFGKLSWAISLLGFSLFIPALLHVRNLKQAPAFAYLGVAFLLLALASTLGQWHATAEVVAGIKRMFQATGLLFALALLPLKESAVARWRKLVFSIALLQLPFALYEFFVLVPKRGGLQAGSAVTDVVAGTFGANLEGGSPNSVMALLLLIVFAFLLARWQAGLLKGWCLFAALPFIFLPIALGEVKIAFVMLPVMLLVLFKGELLRRPMLFVGIVGFAAAIMFALGFVYAGFIIKKPLADILRDTLAYNIQDIGYGSYYLNRTTALVFWWSQQGLHDPIGFVFGHGLGSSFTAPKTLVLGHVAALWPMHGIDLSAAASLLWDTGVVGFMVFMLFFPAAWQACNSISRDTGNPHVKAEASAIKSVIPLFAIFVVYNNTLVNLVEMQILFSLVFGYLAYLCRRLGKAGAPG